MRAISGVHLDSISGIKFTVSKAFAYDVMGWNSTWVSM